MTKKIIIILQISFLISLIACDSDKKDLTTYFGGKIINPKSNQVVLYSMEKVIDTFFLNSDNKFFGKLKNADEGLYYFIHGNENQHIYIEPEDSLMIRLNTWDFDETLVFAGKGAERNNILIDCFLEDEKQKTFFYKYNRLEPKEFKEKVDYLINLKLNTYNNYVNNHPDETRGYKEVLKVALTYPILSRVEEYPIIYAKYSKDGSFPKITDSLYSYRNSINFNKDSLMYYPPYSQYIRNYLYNETYSLGHSPMKRNYSSKFTLDLLNTINNKIESQNTKNAFLKQTLISHFYNKSTCNVNLESFNLFLELSTNEKDKELIKSLLNDSKAISAEENIPDFEVIDYANSNHSIYDVLNNKNTFLLFWNPEYYSESYLVSRINYLSNRYPNINFNTIKIQGTGNDRIKKLDIKNQFYLKSDNTAHKFLTSKMPRTILVNRKGKVINGYASISSYNLIPYLEDLNKN